MRKTPSSGLFLHTKQNPLICPGREKHEFSGLHMSEDGLSGETVCEHCGVGAIAHTMALEDYKEQL